VEELRVTARSGAEGEELRERRNEINSRGPLWPATDLDRRKKSELVSGRKQRDIGERRDIGRRKDVLRKTVVVGVLLRHKGC
jgi:hypothetical protein